MSMRKSVERKVIVDKILKGNYDKVMLSFLNNIEKKI